MRNAAGAFQGAVVTEDLRAAGEAGGFITQIDMHADGTKLIAGDTLQPLWCNTTDPIWRQVLRASTRPAGFGERSGANAAAGKRDQGGCTGAAIAPSNSSRWYLCQEAIILVTSDKGATITMSPQTSYTSKANTGPPRIGGPYLVVHPTDANRVMWGVREGLVLSTDGFATSRALTASVPGTTDPDRMVLVGFDPSNTAVAYAHSWGNGLYKSTNATAAAPTFALVTGSPAKVKRMRVGAGGKVWMTDDAGVVRTCVGTTIANATAPATSWHDIAIDPANASRVVLITENGYTAISADNGGSWSEIWYATYPPPIGIYINAADVPYLGNYAGGFDAGAIMFDPSSSNRLYCVQGLGVQWTSYPSDFGRIDWHTQNRGIRQLIPYSAISPVGGKPMWSSQDRPIFILRDTLDQSALNYGPRASLSASSPDINHGWHLTTSPQDPTFVLAQVNYQINISGYSTDGGATFTTFANKNAPDGVQGGAMAVSANKDQILCFPGNNGVPTYTLDRGVTGWTTLQIPGLPANSSAGQFAYYFRRQALAADSVTPGTFLFYHPGNPYGQATAGFFRIAGGLTNAPIRTSTGYAIPDTAGSGGSCRLEGIPGRAGHFLFAGDSDSQNAPMRRTRDVGATWESVPIMNAIGFSFGARAPGSQHPTCWVLGTYNGVYGIHYSTDDLVTWRTFATNVADEWGGLDIVCADAHEFGLIYVGISGKAWVYARLTDRKLIV